MRRLVVASAVLLAIGGVLVAWRGYGRAADRATPLAAGERAPDIRLFDQHGVEFSLASALAQRDFVVLAFYPKAFTSG